MISIQKEEIRIKFIYYIDNTHTIWSSYELVYSTSSSRYDVQCTIIFCFVFQQQDMHSTADLFISYFFLMLFFLFTGVNVRPYIVIYLNNVLLDVQEYSPFITTYNIFFIIFLGSFGQMVTWRFIQFIQSNTVQCAHKVYFALEMHTQNCYSIK